jgi:hypothetical protein
MLSKWYERAHPDNRLNARKELIKADLRGLLLAADKP